MPIVRTLDNLVVMPSGGANNRVKITEQILGSAAASITFSAIAQTYSHLEVVVTGRSDVASVSAVVYGRFNGDTAANYDYQLLDGTGAGVGGGELFASANGGVMGNVSGASAPAGVASSLIATILDYSRSTWQKAVTSSSASKSGTASGNLTARNVAWFWRNAASITSITVYPASSNFVAGTIATLYGIID